MTYNLAAPIRFSVIVPTIGRIDLLQRCLEHLRLLAPPAGAWEALVMDTSGPQSGEAVRKSVLQAGNGVPGLRYFALPREGLMLGRHRGVREARGEIVSFIDDDSLVRKNWLRGIEGVFSDPKVAMAGGPCLPEYESPPPAWLEEFWVSDGEGRFLADLSLLDYGSETRDIDAGMIWGCNLSIRKQAFLNAGGTHPDCLPDDLQRFQGDGETALSVRIKASGKRAVYHPEICVSHFIPSPRMTIESFSRRAFYQGVCDSFTQIRRKHGLGPSRGVPRQDRTLLGRLRACAWKSKAAILSGLSSPTEPERDARRIRKAMAEAYRRGYRFHQRETRSDPALLGWVLRENYLDCEGIPSNAALPQTERNG